MSAETARLDEALMAAADYEHLRDLVIEQLNPPDDDAAEVSIMATAIEQAVGWIREQPCICPDGEDIDYDLICGRCFVLGRSQDEQVPR